ncbi:MAG: ACP S-malonyltransferase [Lachnospiraceae bacterium]|nr:ACP S-malonyltransferase [uncultured Acetatifactor sp.]MCI9219833.1 ACP S-malonyltransferase [Lachnospiraceae bacterium]
MGKTAFIFPGQGAQYCGMGKDFFDTFPTARQVYATAGEATGMDVARLCFTENKDLDITEYTQIAMLATEAAILKVLEEKGVRADCAAGLSLGEYGALAAAGAMDLPQMFWLIRCRGIFMQEACPVGGAMAAVLGLDAEAIRGICEETEGTVSIANDNCPGQIVITGEARAVQAASERLTAAGARRCIPLNVSGPFHSALLEGAGRKLAAELEHIAVHKPRIPYLCNVEADYVTDASRIKELLARQVSSTVRWRETMERMLADGVDTFVEIGPGRTLAGFLRKMSRDARVFNVAKVEDLDGVLAALQGQDPGEEK